jgi:hypothetical protein
MHLVALTRWSPEHGLEHELLTLARAMRVAPYDARLKLAAPLPVVVAAGLALEPAQELLALLRQRGHGAVTCEASDIPAIARMPVARSFALQSAAMVAQVALDERKRELTLPYAQMLGIVRAAELSNTTQTLVTSEKKVALGRALLSGGVVTKKTVDKTRTNEVAERQQVAYVFVSTSPDPVLLKERSLSYEGLGAERAVTARESLEVLVDRLHRSAPSALLDDRLLVHKRRTDLTEVRGVTADRTVSASNAPANTLAAYLLMLGHLQGQL